MFQILFKVFRKFKTQFNRIHFVGCFSTRILNYCFLFQSYLLTNACKDWFNEYKKCFFSVVVVVFAVCVILLHFLGEVSRTLRRHWQGPPLRALRVPQSGSESSGQRFDPIKKNAWIVPDWTTNNKTR